LSRVITISRAKREYRISKSIIFENLKYSVLKKEEIRKILDSFATKKIMVIGDVMIDSYLWGKVDRISPEAPVPIINCHKHDTRLGGAGNVAINLLSLGTSPILCGVIGNDDNGTNFLKLMQKCHLSNSGIYIAKGRPTTIKTRVIGGNQQLLRIDEETDKPLEGKSELAFIDHIKKIINKENIDAIIFQDYDKGAITPLLINEITSVAKAKKIYTLVDPKKRNFMNYKNVNLFKPNFKELCEGIKTDIPKDNYGKMYEATKEFQSVHSIDTLMITLSERGVYISNHEYYYHIPAHVRDITDVSGAGDTVISVACLCLTAGIKAPHIAEIANLAGGIVCEKVGVVPIEKKRLAEEMQKLKFEVEI
jgi:rfaE bifunctional protein kinase chain/domain